MFTKKKDVVWAKREYHARIRISLRSLFEGLFASESRETKARFCFRFASWRRSGQEYESLAVCHKEQIGLFPHSKLAPE